MKVFTYILFISLIISGCSKSSNELMTLKYDFYEKDSLSQKNALIIQYKKNEKDSFRVVSLTSFVDSIQLLFKERLSDSGIYRSVKGSKYFLTHSFIIGKQVESDLPQTAPFFLNTWIKAIDSKGYFYSQVDSINLIFFDEALPKYSFTSSYYSKELKFFFIFYNQSMDSYFKLAKVEGLMNNTEKSILEVADKLSHDTMFFGKHYRLPLVEPPTLNK